MNNYQQHLLTGKKLLPGFSGEWKLINMNKHASLKDRVGWQALTTEEYLDSGLFFLVTGTDFIGGRVNWNTCHFVNKWRYSQDKNIQLKNGDVLLTKDGTIGKVGYVENLAAPATLNSGVFVIRPLNDSFDPLFLYYILSSRIFDNFLAKIFAGSTISHLYQKDFVKFKFLAPETEEQRSLAQVLSNVDALIAALDKLIAKQRDLKTATMQQLLTGKKRLPGFGGEWERCQLGDVVEKIVGVGTLSRCNPDYWGREIPWATVKDFATFSPFYTQESITKEGLANSASNLIPKGTLITSTRMALGKAVIYEVDVAINQDIKAIFPNSDIDSLYLYFWFQNHAKYIEDLGSGSTVKGISLIDLKRISFLKPSVEEQRVIAKVLSDMDKAIAALEARLAKIQAIKRGMMQELLTGRTRLV